MAADERSQIDPITLPTGEVQWHSGGNGMEAQGEVEVRTVIQSRRGLPMITGLELGPIRELDQMRPSLILCRPGGRDVWQIARECGASPAEIRLANNLQEEPEKGRMLLIPIQ